MWHIVSSWSETMCHQKKNNWVMSWITLSKKQKKNSMTHLSPPTQKKRTHSLFNRDTFVQLTGGNEFFFFQKKTQLRLKILSILVTPITFFFCPTKNETFESFWWWVIYSPKFDEKRGKDSMNDTYHDMSHEWVFSSKCWSIWLRIDNFIPKK